MAKTQEFMVGDLVVFHSTNGVMRLEDKNMYVMEHSVNTFVAYKVIAVNVSFLPMCDSKPNSMILHQLQSDIIVITRPENLCYAEVDMSNVRVEKITVHYDNFATTNHFPTTDTSLIAYEGDNGNIYVACGGTLKDLVKFHRAITGIIIERADGISCDMSIRCRRKLIKQTLEEVCK